ncbi:MAG: hypothetical protein NZ898_06860 [Myxococcota bacterium]|nr:hypothetical protein [Myxococcota bacterium]
MDPLAEQLIARLRRDPDDAEAFAALRAHYHRLGDYASLANLLEGWAARSPDVTAAGRAFYEAAELVLGALGDRPRALLLYQRAIERDPLHEEAVARLRQLFEESGDVRRVVELLERRADALAAAGADPRVQATIQHELGELWERRMQRADRAIGHYRRAFELDPSLVPAIYAAREIYRNAGNYKAAASLYDLEIAAEPDPGRRLALLRELAYVRADRLGDLEGAIAALRRALSMAPGDLAVMHEMATMLLRRAERSVDAAAATEDRRRAADLLHQMAEVVPLDHALAYAEAALDAAPDHEAALALLERLAPQCGRQDLLPLRWVAYLHAAPDGPVADEVRRRLGQAYVDVDQIEDAVACWEPLLERGDVAIAEALLPLYRRLGRGADTARALSVALAALPPEERVGRLWELVTLHVAEGEHDLAEARARELLAIDPTHGEALGHLEARLRARGAWSELRELWLAAARVAGQTVEARKLRLREVAEISERRLGDPDGAIGAWRAVAALDPTDEEARAALERLLEQVGRWDELVQVLERRVLGVVEPDEKAALLARIADIHRERRGDLHEALVALRSLYELRPADPSARERLCDVLLEAGAYLEAVPLLRLRLETATGAERVRLLRLLADVLETRVGDEEGAFETAARLLDEEPGDRDAIARMRRIDETAGNWSRLLETLSYEVEVAAQAERASLYAQMGRIADERLGDLERAAEYYGKAVDLDPASTALLDALCDVYDRAGRYRDLVVLLRQRASREPEAAARAEVYRRIARVLAERVRNEDAAAEAWGEVLAAGEDEEALRYLLALARKRDDPAGRADLAGRLARRVEHPEERRDLLFERAEQLATRLGDDEAAVEALREVLDVLDPQYLPALALLADVHERRGQLAALAEVLERRLAITEDEGLRVPLAARLADLYEGPLADPARAIAVLQIWADADLTDPVPQRRLVPLLERTGRHADVVAVLDALAGIEQDPAEVGRLVRRAAAIALERLGDVDGAWNRLEARVVEGDEGAEEDLRALARTAARGEALAALYARLAAEATEKAERVRRWMDAAHALDEMVGAPERALEASLQALAADLDRLELLEDVDRFAAAAGAWDRLAQVYDTLLRRLDDDEVRVGLLRRHARLLDERAGDPSAALDRILRAAAMRPDDDELLAEAERLAARSGRADELFVVYERRQRRAADDAGRVDALLRAVRLADGVLGDRARAMELAAQAVALSVRSPELAEPIERAILALDEERGEPAGESAARALVELYRQLADRSSDESPDEAALLLERAARLQREVLDDEPGAFATLVAGLSFAPRSASLHEALESVAERLGRFADLERWLARVAAEAVDAETTLELMRRRGRILEVELERYAEAADVYASALALRPHDVELQRALQGALRRSGRLQELVVVLERDVERTSEAARRVALLEEIALVWERDLHNRWEALDAWKRLLTIAPDHEAARAALGRLGASTRRLSPDELEDELAQPPARPPRAATIADDDALQPAEDSAVTALPPARSTPPSRSLPGNVASEWLREAPDASARFEEDSTESPVPRVPDEGLAHAEVGDFTDPGLPSPDSFVARLDEALRQDGEPAIHAPSRATRDPFGSEPTTLPGRFGSREPRVEADGVRAPEQQAGVLAAEVSEGTGEIDLAEMQPVESGAPAQPRGFDPIFDDETSLTGDETQDAMMASLRGARLPSSAGAGSAEEVVLEEIEPEEDVEGLPVSGPPPKPGPPPPPSSVRPPVLGQRSTPPPAPTSVRPGAAPRSVPPPVPPPRGSPSAPPPVPSRRR